MAKRSVRLFVRSDGTTHSTDVDEPLLKRKGAVITRAGYVEPGRCGLRQDVWYVAIPLPIPPGVLYPLRWLAHKLGLSYWHRMGPFDDRQTALGAEADAVMALYRGEPLPNPIDYRAVE